MFWYHWKFNLNWNIWKQFLKTSTLDFSGQRLGNTSLVVFLRFHSFSQVVKWPKFVWVYTTNILNVQCQISLTDRGPLCLREVLREVLGSLPTGTSVFEFKYCLTCQCACYQAKPIILEKTLGPNYHLMVLDCLSHIARIDLASFALWNERGWAMWYITLRTFFF